MVVRLRASAGGRRGASSRSEYPVALLVDDLLCLRDREGGCIVPAGMGLGADESMLLHAVGEVLLDGSRGLELPVRPIGSRPDAIALVFHGVHGGFAGLGG